MTWLDRAHEELNPPQLNANTDPRFDDLLHLIGLPES
jgi:hypothetical protein